MAAVPDMSHLTPGERRTIEEVIIRQKQEEEKENEIMRLKQDEVKILEDMIRACSEKHKKAGGVELQVTCHICLKTKFADGIGHICNYCSIRCCARCGGKVTLRSNKVVWVCILCRKKQELLSKTGQWITKTGLAAGDNALLRRMQDMQVGGPPGLVDQAQDKRPKLERAHSAAEKENLPLLLRSGNLLKRQYSQQEQESGRRMSTTDSGVDMTVSPHSRSLPTPHVAPSHQTHLTHQTHQTHQIHQTQQPPRHPEAYAEDDPSLYRGEIDGLMERLSEQQRQRPIYPDQHAELAMTYGQGPVEAGPPRTMMHPSQQHSVHQMQSAHLPQPVGGQPGLQPQRSFSSSEEERSTPECASDEPDESEKGDKPPSMVVASRSSREKPGDRMNRKGYYHRMGSPMSMSDDGRRHNGSRNGHHRMTSMIIEYNGHRHSPRETRKEENTLVRRSFRRSGDEWRADSRRFTERRGKKTVRFDGGTNVGGPQEDQWSWEADRQGSQDSATKDSGIDTSSTFTSSEDSNRGDLMPKHTLSWQASRDGQKIIGHMVLRKQPGSGNIVGLKVVGGKLLEDGSMGAVIERVMEGSTADIEGQLRAGDEVIKWNGKSLQGKTFREVCDIIDESRSAPQVELVVSRNISSTRRIVAQTPWRQKHPETIPAGPQPPHHKGLKKCILWELYDARREKPSVLVTSPGSPDLHAQGRGRHLRHPTGNANIGGNLQVKLGFDPLTLRLIVTLICAAGLMPRSTGQPRNPYAKIFLLPDKSEKSKRRTNTLANTNDPRWNQTFVYEGVRKLELRKRALEITVWDYGKHDTNDFLGEAVLELATARLDEEPEWLPLTDHGEHRHIGYYQEPDEMAITPVDCHLSPPSTTSRLSDSDTSECDITDCDVSREQRKTADGASISSIGSSSSHYSSPPPERELCVDGEHRSRRDMSPQGRKRALMIRDQPASISGYHSYRKDDIHRGMMGHRSHSAAPMDSPSLRYRGRSQSPTGHRSLSPPEHRSIPYSHGYVQPRFSSRSATATPTGSPKKRQLPLIPTALKERAAQDLQDRARFMRHRNRPVHNTYRSTGMGGWEKHYSGLSDSDLPSIDHDPLSLPHSHAYRMHRSRRGHSSPDKDVLGDLGDSDMESIASVTSSAFSTQSERPRGSRGLIPTVKNVLIPGVISPMPLPPRRNRRRHRLRVPCSECHCPNNNPTGTDTNTNTSTNTNAKPPRSNNPGKHNPTTPHPLVRSKSAVVRSLYRKMRTPFTRSQTVDENMLRYYSPETSEYSVSAGYILKPEELTGNSKKRIPEIYVEDCLKVDFNDRLVEKFRDRYSSPYLTSSTATTMTGPRSGSARRSRSWLGARRSRRSAAKSRLEPTSFTRFTGSRDDRETPKAADDLGIANLDVSSRPRRSFLFAKARSFDYDVLHDAYAGRYDLGGSGNGLLSRRAKSFEYDTVSSNIFSDDSLRTARRKLKKNLAINDAGYGDKILALGDRSKSYFDSNGDDKLESKKARRLARTKNYDYHQLAKRRSTFYGYDSELSGAETEIYVPRFDGRFVDSDVSLGNGYRSSRRYQLSEGNSFSSCSGDDQLGLRDVLGRSGGEPPKRSITTLGSDMSDAANEHIYCSIDEALSSSQPRSYVVSDSERYDVRRRRSRRKTKTASAYPENGYDDYVWDDDDVEYDDEGFVDRGRMDAYDRRPYDYDEERGDTRLYEDSNGGGYGYGYGYCGGDGGGGDDDDYYEGRRETKRSSRYEDVVDTTEFDGDGYRDYRSADEYDYRARTDSERVHADAYRDANTLPRRRRRRRSKEAGVGIYENLQPYRDVSQIDPSVPTFASERAKRTMRLQRAESTPAVLRSDEELSSSERAERARRLYRRRRNASCPEARELGRYDDDPSSQRRRTDEERRSRFVTESDEEFGSMETVVCADCFRRRNVEADGRYYETERARDVCAGVDSRCVECEAARARDYYPYDREFARSGSLRARYRGRRKSSCPECRELAMRESDRSGSLSRAGEDRRPSIESRHRYRRRNSSCPEARDLELQQRHREAHQHPPPGVDARSRQQRSQEERHQRDREQQQQQHQQQGSKRNVAISDTLEYYEYSMESESQCSENCGFGPCDPRRPRNRAPHPGNANSSLFDSQTATSDTAKNYHPRAVDHHDTSRNTKPSPRGHLDDETTTPSSPTSSSTHRRRSRKKTDDEPRDDRARDRRSSSVPESSEYSTGQSSSYEKTSRSQPPDSEHDDHNRRGQFTRSLSNDAPQDEKVDGSLSDTAIGLNVEDSARRPRKSSPGSKNGSGSSSGGGSAVQYQSNLGKKSNSTSQLSATECGGICVGSGIAGLSSRKRNSTPSSIQRSEEIVPYQRFESGKQTESVASDTAGSLNSISSSEGSSWSPSIRMTGETGQLRDFIEDLGPGQFVGRQALGARCLGAIQLSLTQKNRSLEVEVIRAKDLQPKQDSKAIPAPYVKVYLVNGKKCIAKMKTGTARKTLDPFYQQSLTFREDCQGCILQVAVWGDYGRLEGKKVFMGIANIVLDELNLNETKMAWYKLFGNMPL